MLPNGDAKSEHGGDESTTADSVAEVEGLVETADEEPIDIKEKVADIKEAIIHAPEEKTAGVENGGHKEIGRKGKKADKFSERKYEPNGYAHAPRWPQLRKPHYQVMMGDSKLNKVIIQPIRITDIPLPRTDGLPSEPREYSLQFQAPPQASLFSFVLYALSDTFLGADVERPIMVSD